MQEAVAIVVVVVGIGGAVAAVLSLAAGRRAYGEIGGGGPTGESAREPTLEEEIREHVERRNARLVARGRPPLDVDAEVERRLQAPEL